MQEEKSRTVNLHIAACNRIPRGTVLYFTPRALKSYRRILFYCTVTHLCHRNLILMIVTDVDSRRLTTPLACAGTNVIAKLLL